MNNRGRLIPRRAASACNGLWLFITLILLTRVGPASAVAVAVATQPSGLHDDEMRAHFINVGQGSAVLLEFPCGAALIDTGGEKSTGVIDSVQVLHDYLDTFFARRSDLNKQLDLLLITHAHIDHARGIPMVLKYYKVSRYIDNKLTTGSGGRQQKAAQTARRAANQIVEGITQREVTRWAPQGGLQIGSINCGDSRTSPRFTALWGSLDRRDGWDPKVMKNGNNSSIVVRLEFGAASFLFPGDLDEAVQPEFIHQFASLCAARQSEQRGPHAANPASDSCPLHVNAFEVSHHGADNGTSQQLMEAMRPRMAIISMGDLGHSGQWTANAFGHPRKVAIETILQGLDRDDSRKTMTVKVALRGAPRKKTATPPASRFEEIQLTRSIYATAWDGTVIVDAFASGQLTVEPSQAARSR